MNYCRFLAKVQGTASLVLIAAGSLVGASAHAQARPLITSAVDMSNLTELKGNVSPKLKGATDLGAADPSQPSGRLLLQLKRSAEQEADLQSFLQQVHQSSSANFHKWLSPAAFGQRFGAADSDIEQVKGWLESQGLSVAGVSTSKGMIEYSGTVGQVNAAFHTSIHSYKVGGVTHYANASNPSIPAALAPAVASVGQLDDFRPVAQNKVMGQATFDPKTHTGKPQWTYPSPLGQTYYFLTPEDFSTQYDVKSVYSAGLNGSGQTIGIINDSNVNLELVNAYRKLFGLPANPPQVVIDGADPGINGDAIEAYLDVENAGAIAPNATVKLYIASSYGIVGGGINFSLLRAVDDDAASVLSLSFGECESDLGTAGSQFVNSLWEQAAAQGQTVLVSTGDSGSYDNCYGVGVNGLASTPWDVAVGGTDAYFSDYATGGASIVNYWNSANDADLGSLQKPFTEQPWNGSIYGFNSTVYDPYAQYNSVGGGGGKSSCAVGDPTVNPTTGLPTCTAGYPKPSWQVGSGVPHDGVRDLPDVSLFASNSVNGISWAICAEPGDCTEDLPGGTNLLVTDVGGTSASAPAMAGIMALINQKYGPQGQANYTLYPLAAQFPTVINPVDIGSNNEPCQSYEVGSEIGCAADPGNTGHYSLQNYPATPGYDLASGLGTVDVAALIANWNSISFKSSATTLTLSPATITHGQTVTANVEVTGTGTPAGSVALISNVNLPGYTGLTAIPLGANGTGTSSIVSLPGGTFTVYGQYSGDGINGASKSASTTITVTPENSVIQLTPQYLNLNTYQVASLPAGGNVPFDSELVLDATVFGASLPANATTFGHATGSITFSDNGTSIGTVPLSSAGTAELSGYTLAAGKHSITLSYPGDASYNPSTSSAFTFTVQQQSTGVTISPDLACPLSYSSYPFVADCASGTPTVNSVIVGSEGSGTGVSPTGTVSYQFDSQPAVSVPVSPIFLSFVPPSYPSSLATVVLPAMSAGTHTLTVTYSGDINYSGSTTSQAFLATASPLIQSTTTLDLTSPSDPSSITPGSAITLTATVTGANGVAPTGTVGIVLAGAFESASVKLVPGANGTSTAVIQELDYDFTQGQNFLTAYYSGDKNYLPSTSLPLTTVSNPISDFSLQAENPNVAVAAGSTATATINLASISGFSGPISLSCAVPASFTCSVSTASLTPNGTATATLTLNAFTTSTAMDDQPKWVGETAAPVLACLLFFVLPKRRRYGRILMALLFMAVVSAGIGCGGKSSQPGPIVVTTTTKAASGTYNVVVTGSSGTGIIHNTTITVVVQ
jgi:hypothetical protein